MSEIQVGRVIRAVFLPLGTPEDEVLRRLACDRCAFGDPVPHTCDEQQQRKHETEIRGDRAC